MTTKRLILLIDESGSMYSQRLEIIDAINITINSQKKLQSGNIIFDVFRFNDRIKHQVSKPLKLINSLTTNDYSPRGSTALYDAIGYSINKYQSEKDVVMIIATDGMENASREYSHTSMLSLINQQRNVNNWKFIYLSENPETERQGEYMGIKNNLKNCSNTNVGRGKCCRVLGSSSLQTYISDVSSNKTSLSYDDWQKL